MQTTRSSPSPNGRLRNDYRRSANRATNRRDAPLLDAPRTVTSVGTGPNMPAYRGVDTRPRPPPACARPHPVRGRAHWELSSPTTTSRSSRPPTRPLPPGPLTRRWNCQYTSFMTTTDRTQPPAFCQYAAGECDQSFARQLQHTGIFLYPSDPPQIAATVETAARNLRKQYPSKSWITWKDFQTAGQIIFCAICKSCRFAQSVIADVTTLNFNLMFEIGFCLGLGVPVVPIRDTTFVRHRRVFDQLGLLDVIGYVDFQNADGLATALADRLPVEALPLPSVTRNYNEPVYVLKAPIKTEGEVRLMSALKKSALN